MLVTISIGTVQEEERGSRFLHVGIDFIRVDSTREVSNIKRIRGVIPKHMPWWEVNPLGLTIRNILFQWQKRNLLIIENQLQRSK